MNAAYCGILNQNWIVAPTIFFIISLYWEKQQQIESAWKAFDSLQYMLLCFARKAITCICQISLITLLAN
jgi:predicted ATPase